MKRRFPHNFILLREWRLQLISLKYSDIVFVAASTHLSAPIQAFILWNYIMYNYPGNYYLG